MSDGSLRVIKLGGSLLNRPHLAEALKTWQHTLEPMQDVFLTGGGQLANAVRDLDKAHLLNQQISHWLAIDAMSVTTCIASTLLPESRIVQTMGDLSQTDTKRKFSLLDVRNILREEEPFREGTRLPHSWAATGDSIAARLAEMYDAEELVLLKSTLPNDCTDWHSAAKTGFVDQHFPLAVQTVKRAYCVNLADPAQCYWEPAII